MLVAAAVLLFLASIQGALDSTFFQSGMLVDDARHPVSLYDPKKKGDFVTVGHYKGRLRQGTEKRCNGVTCTPRFKYSFKSRGSQDIFVSKYNSSRNLQWARVAGGPGDDKAQAVTVTMEGKIAVAGFFHGSDIKFGKDNFDTFELSSRTILSRTLFLAVYSSNGTAELAVEAASCGVGMCDVTSVAGDETGIVLTGRYRKRISFGVGRNCTADYDCVLVERGFLSTGEDYVPPPPPPPPGIEAPPPPPPNPENPARQKSTGSGFVYRNFCWVAKYNNHGNYLWHRDCYDPALNATDAFHNKEATTEQHAWAEKAREFWHHRPVDKTKYVGKEEQYDQYARYRTYEGDIQPADFKQPHLQNQYGLYDPPGTQEREPLQDYEAGKHGDMFFGTPMQSGNPGNRQVKLPHQY